MTISKTCSTGIYFHVREFKLGGYVKKPVLGTIYFALNLGLLTPCHTTSMYETFH